MMGLWMSRPGGIGHWVSGIGLISSCGRSRPDEGWRTLWEHAALCKVCLAKHAPPADHKGRTTR